MKTTGKKIIKSDNEIYRATSLGLPPFLLLTI
nr:MAG TPA: hypothetical protein [Herelleviridae sp.]